MKFCPRWCNSVRKHLGPACCISFPCCIFCSLVDLSGWFVIAVRACCDLENWRKVKQSAIFQLRYYTEVIQLWSILNKSVLCVWVEILENGWSSIIFQANAWWNIASWASESFQMLKLSRLTCEKFISWNISISETWNSYWLLCCLREYINPEALKWQLAVNSLSVICKMCTH